MSKYTITFNGRLKGTIGATYQITDTVEADTFVEANLKLYDKYDHIHVVSFTKEA